MKEQIMTCILPELPIVGTLKLSSRDGKSLCSINVVRKQAPTSRSAFFEGCYKKLSTYLNGSKKSLTLPLDFKGLTDFQINVLTEMKKIPYGEVATYKHLASSMKSRAYQAIGSACGRNPFMLIYPCHRVVGSNDLGGFAHGLKMKVDLLKLEGAL